MKTLKLGTLLSGVLVTGAGTANTGNPAQSGTKTFHAFVLGTGAVTATVKVQVSNNGTYWEDLGIITLTGTTSASDGFASSAGWAYYRGNVTAISGTGAAVTLTCAQE